MALHVVITAGGTREPIDEVRCIANSSTGSLGMRIANKFLQMEPDCKITYICGKGALSPEDERVNRVVVGSVADLLSAIDAVAPTPDIFVHSMAVSDYTVDYVFDKETGERYETGGKISSALQSPCIALKPTPKVIGLIKKKWPHVFLIGFKLLDRVTKEDLFQTAFQLLRKNRCNLVLANDIHEIRQGAHSGMIVFPEKTQKTYQGKDAIAENLVRTALNRYRVHHHVSVLDPESDEAKSLVSSVLPRFHATGQRLAERLFLPEVTVYERGGAAGTYGNMSMRVDNTRFVITGRNVNKGALTENDLVLVNQYEPCDEEAVVGKIHYVGAVKPSIDAAIHHHIYQLRPDVQAMLHIHTNLSFKYVPTTDYNFPCGCQEEAKALTTLVANNPRDNIYQMVDHGLLILGSSLEDCELQLLGMLRPSLISSRLYFHATFRKYLPSIREHGLKAGEHKNYSFSNNCICLIDGYKVKDPIGIAASFCEAAELTDADTYASGIAVLAVREEDLPSIPQDDPNIHYDTNKNRGYAITVQGTIPASKLTFFWEEDT